MLFAIVDDKKIEPIPNTHAQCHLCGEKVLSRCGEIKVWHWAHFKGKSCDSWYEPETQWHRSWKLTFGKENSEIKIIKEDCWHVADVLTEGKVVIELQNSPIQKDIIRRREEFYGERMIWLINGIEFRDNFYIKDWDNKLNWWNPQKNNFKHREVKKMFKWEYPRKSWENTQRHIFIDFHDKSLFWVHKGMGTKRGEGKYVSKQEFVSKYGGDYKKHLSLFRNWTLNLNRNNLRLEGIKEKNIHLITSIKHNGKIRMLEIYFENEVDVFKIEKLHKVIINGTLNFEEENKNLQLISSKFVE
jgi:competence CoiA-like predicted nuclease